MRFEPRPVAFGHSVGRHLTVVFSGSPDPKTAIGNGPYRLQAGTGLLVEKIGRAHV